MDGWGHCAAKELGEPFPCPNPVLPLRAVLFAADGEHRPRKSRRESVDYSFTLDVVQRGCRAHIETQLYAGVGSIDALTAGPGRTGELLDQLTRRYPETARDPRAGRHVQVIHRTSVPQLAI